MSHKFGIGVLLIAALGAPAAMASPIHYTLSFSGSPLLPTSGEFTYDPDIPQFSSFLVTWQGINFDLTGSADAPGISSTAPSCIGGATGAAATAALLLGSCNPSSGGTAVWEAILFGNGDSYFTFASDADQAHLPPQTPDPGIAIQAEATGPVFGGAVALNPLGSFSATQTTVSAPEPSSLGIFAAGLVAMVIWRIGHARQSLAMWW
jgi:hypothetical protein